jgi:phospho-N-acetylmuramoyl-pentapeptide-transferase
MLYHLLFPLRDIFTGFNLFRYITFRSAYAAITALLFSFFVGPHLIKLLQRKQMKQVIRTDGPQSHLSKSGTPTMGGIIVLLAIFIPVLLWGDLTNFYVRTVLLVTVWMGLVGFADDYLKIVQNIPKGLIARYKLLGQISLGIILALFILYLSPEKNSPHITTTTIPILKNATMDWGGFFIPVVILVITGYSNAVNITDGLDGLAIGLLGIAFACFAIICYLTGNVIISKYLNIIYLPGTGELSVYCAAALGASLGFLWFNAHPAKIFMGDVGSLALGGALGAIALLVKKELLLVVIGAVFAAETLSVIIQVAYFKRTKKKYGAGKRLFRMAPLHHHFELQGWKETTVVIRFWIIGILFALLSLSTFKIQ